MVLTPAMPSYVLKDKSVISDRLKGKLETVVFCPMSPVQQLIYQRILDMPEVVNLRRKDEPCDCPHAGADQ